MPCSSLDVNFYPPCFVLHIVHNCGNNPKMTNKQDTMSIRAPLTTQPIRTLADLGSSMRSARKGAKMSAVELSARSGHSRNTIHRVEAGEDCSASTLLWLLKSLGYTLEIRPSRRPTLDEVSHRFADDEDGR